MLEFLDKEGMASSLNDIVNMRKNCVRKLKCSAQVRGTHKCDEGCCFLRIKGYF
jgi:hypothetical protein